MSKQQRKEIAHLRALVAPIIRDRVREDLKAIDEDLYQRYKVYDEEAIGQLAYDLKRSEEKLAEAERRIWQLEHPA